MSRIPRFMPVYEFLLSIVLSIYVGFFRVSHIRFVSRDPMLTVILKVTHLPPQFTFWRFLASLHLAVASKCSRCSARCGNGCGRQPTCAWLR